MVGLLFLEVKFNEVDTNIPSIRVIRYFNRVVSSCFLNEQLITFAKEHCREFYWFVDHFFELERFCDFMVELLNDLNVRNIVVHNKIIINHSYAHT